MPLDIKAKLEAEQAAIRIRDRNPDRWDGIGHNNRRGHLFYY